MPRGKGTGPARRKDAKANQRVASGKAYGERAKSLGQQQAMPTTDRPAAMQQDAAALASTMDPRDAAQAMTPPTGTLTGPTRRPNEPPTAGLPLGPGPGPEAVPPVGRPAISSDALLFARYLPAFELLASAPSSTSQMRQMVRRLRSQIPPGHIRETVMAQAGAYENVSPIGSAPSASATLAQPGGGVTQQSPSALGPQASAPTPRTPGPAPSQPAGTSNGAY